MSDDQAQEIIFRLVSAISSEKEALGKYRDRWSDLGIKYSEFRVEIYREAIAIVREIMGQRDSEERENETK